MKKTSQANLIKKLCHLPATNDLKKAIFEYDKLVRSTYTLKYMMDSKLQKTVNKSQNRIESYHQLRADISKVGGKKQLYGKTDIDVEISNQCNRLVCNTIIYYNSIILSRVLEKYDTQNNKKKLLSIIKRISPISWHHHIHFSGQYTFQGNDSTIDIDEFLKNFNLDL
jgi:TnpA family transposase